LEFGSGLSPIVETSSFTDDRLLKVYDVDIVMNNPAAKPTNPRGRARPQDIDRHVGNRMRERRIMLGLTQQQMADLIGVTYQQAHKYEKGINRIAAGRLYNVARALGVEVGFFFEGLDDAEPFRPTPQQRMLLELARNFISLPNRRHQEAICMLARTLADDRGTAELEVDADAAAEGSDGAAA
jgi:transcriptional regulator with XRE-family HTH domain